MKPLNRRDFIRNASRHAAAVAVPVAGAAIAGTSEVYARLSDQLGRTADALGAGIRELSSSFGHLAGRVDTLEARYRLVMLLLLVSLLIDGGMTWMLLGTPVPPAI